MCAANPDIRPINVISEKSVQAKQKHTTHTAKIAETEDNEIICAVTTLVVNLVQNLIEWILDSGAL